MKRSAGCTSDKINEFGIDQRRSWPVRYSLKPVQPLPYVFHPSRGRKTTRDWARTVNRRLLYMYSSPTLPETVGEISYLVKTIRQRSHSSHRRTIRSQRVQSPFFFFTFSRPSRAETWIADLYVARRTASTLISSINCFSRQAKDVRIHREPSGRRAAVSYGDRDENDVSWPRTVLQQLYTYPSAYWPATTVTGRTEWPYASFSAVCSPPPG